MKEENKSRITPNKANNIMVVEKKKETLWSLNKLNDLTSSLQVPKPIAYRERLYKVLKIYHLSLPFL